ncbi:hypothetical protein [Rosistilla carotiformis]|uniref:hypothetical protein n=1 Tax=Rosistilla carotiformis TaxID=2528017 RepID=UPI0011A79BBD|nr:hypothetical protein [Rosistilla carotiformis]
MHSPRARLSTLLLYFLLFAGGPGMHYAPIFGLHGHGDCSHANCPTEKSVCHDGCCHEAAPTDSVAGFATDCDGACALCDFYSHANPTIASPQRLAADDAIALDGPTTSVGYPNENVASYSPRGPPRV